VNKLIVGAMLLAGCGDWAANIPGLCLIDVQAFTRGLMLERTDDARIVTRPDEQTRGQFDAGIPSYVSGASDGGRLILLSDGPFVSGTLPVVFSKADCDTRSENAYFYVIGASNFDPVTATLTVSDGGTAADGGHLTALALTNMVATGDDGGILFAVPDRTFIVDLP
jgi:hypothetical protein